MAQVIHVTTVELTVNVFLIPLLRHLQLQGYQVRAACKCVQKQSEVVTKGISMCNIHHLTRKITPLQDCLALVELYLLFLRERPHIVHTHTPKANLLGRIAARLAGVPIVIGMEHGFYFLNMRGLKRFVYVIISRFGAWLSDKTIVINHYDFDLALREKIIENGRLVLCPTGLGVDLGRFRKEHNHILSKSKLNIDGDAVVVVFVGRLNVEKGCRELIRAMGRVNTDFPKFRLLMIGPSEDGLKGELEKLALLMNIENKIHFLGEREDIPHFLAIADMLVLPSYREGLGMVLLEAAAASKPVVTTDIRGCQDVVVHDETGLLVPPGTVRELAEAILDLIQNADKRRRFGEAARRRAEEMFDQNIFFDQMDDLYSHLLQEKGIPLK